MNKISSNWYNPFGESMLIEKEDHFATTASTEKNQKFNSFANLHSSNLCIVNLTELVKDVIQIFQARIEEKRLNLIVDLPLETKYTKIDKWRVQQILMNILASSVQFTQKGSIMIKVTCDPIQNVSDKVTYTFSIKDTGTGITKQDHDDIELGLYISKILVECMNGSLEVKSELNKGSEFLFSIPCPRLCVEEIMNLENS